jgi:hypothetical protein
MSEKILQFDATDATRLVATDQCFAITTIIVVRHDHVFSIMLLLRRNRGVRGVPNPRVVGRHLSRGRLACKGERLAILAPLFEWEEEARQLNFTTVSKERHICWGVLDILP